MQTTGRMFRRLHDDRYAVDRQRAQDRRRMAAASTGAMRPTEGRLPLPTIAVLLRLISRPS